MTAPLLAAAAHTSNWYWYFGRATGLIALVLLTATIVLGVLGPLRIFNRLWPRFAIRTLHRDLALLSLVVIAIHIVTTVLDGYVHIPLSAAVLPFGSSYRPVWMALGAVAFDLLLAIVLTSLLRRRFGDQVWRFTHWFTYVSWPIAVAHGLGSGSDSTSAWALVLTIGCCAIVAVAAFARFRSAQLRSTGRRPTGTAQPSSRRPWSGPMSRRERREMPGRASR